MFEHISATSATDYLNMTICVSVDVVYLDNYKSGKELEYAHDGDSGFDFRAAFPSNLRSGQSERLYLLKPGDVEVIPTGVKMAIPRNFELQVRTRSGSPLKKGFHVANSPGTVDSGYRGEIGVIIQNISDKQIVIHPGERIAQGVLCPVYKADFHKVKELDSTERGSGAYNSTGTK
jgi:dUTP pyrophosphatase